MSRPTASTGVPLGPGGCEKGHFLAGCEMKALRDGSNGFISFESIDPLPTISDHTGDEAVFGQLRPQEFPWGQGDVKRPLPCLPRPASRATVPCHDGLTSVRNNNVVPHRGKQI